MYITQLCARRAQRNISVPEGHKETPSIYKNPPSVGMKYQIPSYIFHWHILPKVLAAHIQYKCLISESYITQFIKRTHRWRCKQIVFQQLYISTEWQTTCKTRHKMALLTNLNHTLLKVNHYVKKNFQKEYHDIYGSVVRGPNCQTKEG